MIKGIGVDIIKVKRIEKAANDTKSFVKGVYTDREISYFINKANKYETMAGIFAAKEAFSKALGTGIRGFRLTDIEIITDNMGKPDIIIGDKIKKLFDFQLYKTHLSISHTSEEAIAFVVLEEA